MEKATETDVEYDNLGVMYSNNECATRGEMNYHRMN